jgi:proteasome accessory factor A
VLLRNGARLRLEAASHPEYATPECDNLLDLIAHDKAGERILEELGVDAQRRLREAGIAADVYLFKNSTDPAGKSPGCRENYQGGRSSIPAPSRASAARCSGACMWRPATRT